MDPAVPISFADEPSALEFPMDESHIQRNKYGGIHVERSDIQTVFKFIDPKLYNNVKSSGLRHRVSLFDRELKSKDYKLLMTGKDSLGIDDLYGILKNNELENFDPVMESFRYLDPDGTGQVNMERLKELW